MNRRSFLGSMLAAAAAPAVVKYASLMKLAPRQPQLVLWGEVVTESWFQLRVNPAVIITPEVQRYLDDLTAALHHKMPTPGQLFGCDVIVQETLPWGGVLVRKA